MGEIKYCCSPEIINLRPQMRPRELRKMVEEFTRTVTTYQILHLKERAQCI
jgi:hypothetical protein